MQASAVKKCGRDAVTQDASLVKEDHDVKSDWPKNSLDRREDTEMKDDEHLGPVWPCCNASLTLALASIIILMLACTLEHYYLLDQPAGSAIMSRPHQKPVNSPYSCTSAAAAVSLLPTAFHACPSK